MKLEHQVCSLELAKQLKELGVKQESIFYFSNLDTPYLRIDLWWEEPEKSGDFRISAFTSAELGAMLPDTLAGKQLYHWHTGAMWFIGYLCENGMYQPAKVRTTEADARAQMLVHLLENKLMELPNE